MTTVALGDVADINPRGDRPSVHEEVSFVGMADLSAEIGVAGPGTVRPFEDVSKGYTIFRDRDLLVAKITPCFENGKIGQAQLSRPIGVGSTEFHVVRPNADRLDPRYALHFLRQAWIRQAGELRMTGSGGQRRVPAGFVSGLEVPLPPIEEQRRIAAILDQAARLMSSNNEARKGAATLVQAVYAQRVASTDAPKVALADLCHSPDDIKCGPFGTQLKRSEFRSTGVPLWGIKQVNRAFGIPTHEFLDESTAQRLRSYDIVPGDIVMTRKGTVGNCAVYPEHEKPGIMHSDLLRIRVDTDRVLPEFLSHQLHHSPAVAGQLARQSSGAVMPGLNVAKLKGLLVRIPALDAQREFVHRLKGVQSVQDRMQRQGDELAAFFAALQGRAFSGRL